MKVMENLLNRYLSPVANRMNENAFFATLSAAFMRSLPVTIGVAVILIAYGIPIPAWQTYIWNSDLNNQFVAALGASMNALGIYVAFNFAYLYAKRFDQNGLNAGMIAVMNFLILMPQALSVPQLTENVTKGAATVKSVETLTAFQTQYTGGGGLIVAIVVAYIVAKLFVVMNQHHITIKMPAGVPPMVEEAMGPAIISMIITTGFFIVRILFWLSPVHDMFTLISTVIQIPLQNLTGNPLSIIILATLTNLFWFFGLHPSLILGVSSPLLLAIVADNATALTAGKPIPYLLGGLVYLMTSNMFGGQGQTYGLVISMFTAKSARYKQMLKLEALPALFNVNEPLIFGMPIMLNPIFFFPMFLVAPITGFATWGMVKLLGITRYSAGVMLPWTMPGPVQAIMYGGLSLLLIFAVVTVLAVLIWYPFFKIADNRAVAEEAAAETEGAK